MKYYPHHIGDFDRATRHLTRIERSVYRDLIELYYDTEQQLPLDIGVLCRKIIARTDEERTAVEQALNEFFTKTEHGWYHDRCENEIAAYHANTSQKSLAGKASAAKRALKKQQAINSRSTSVQHTSNGAATNQQPTTNNQQPEKNISAGALDVALETDPEKLDAIERELARHDDEPLTKAPKRAPKSAADLPDWMPLDAWSAYVTMRKKIKKPLTDEAVPLAIGKLDKLRAAGHSPEAVLNQSTLNSWQGLFEVRDGGSSQARPAGRPSMNDFNHAFGDDANDPFNNFRRA